ncbi:MAG: ATP synthase F1 subunit delta [Ruminococcaceae bacterium]|nr:ATP synthase F1 subunit delta [Oscillospiraceae bacterium]MBQ9692061.1 ATP synthase F1 subunit delta [Clostridia bacterium]
MVNSSEYGRALFMLTEEAARTEAAFEDVKAVQNALRNDPGYVKLLDTPALSKEEKLMLIDKAFAKVDEYVLNLIKILCENHSVYMFDKTAETFFELYDEARGIERVEAVTAVALSDEQKKKLASKLASVTGKRIIIKNTVSKEILGGIQIRYSGKQIDGSIKTRLDSFEKSLKKIVI